jgi:hypothetical protein
MPATNLARGLTTGTIVAIGLLRVAHANVAVIHELAPHRGEIEFLNRTPCFA